MIAAVSLSKREAPPLRATEREPESVILSKQHVCGTKQATHLGLCASDHLFDCCVDPCVGLEQLSNQLAALMVAQVVSSLELINSGHYVVNGKPMPHLSHQRSSAAVTKTCKLVQIMTAIDCNLDSVRCVLVKSSTGYLKSLSSFWPNRQRSQVKLANRSHDLN